MTALYNFLFTGKIRLGEMLILIFFVHMSAGCKQKTTGELSLVMTGKQATGIGIPNSLVQNSHEENIRTGMQVFLQNSDIPMLGEFEPVDDSIIFRPLIPLTPGSHYIVRYKKTIIGQLSIPLSDATDRPELVAVYPSIDTLPENLLKVYLQFSSPMREGEALNHIHLLDERADTIPGIFLDLQPELWNAERTTLTIWLDPGRIKRGLIPNQRLGNPLKKGMHYTLVIDDQWKNAQGLLLKHAFKKRFFVQERDDASPLPAQWKMVLPQVNTSQPLHIAFTESLDYFLAKETVQILNEKNAVIDGNSTLMNKETELDFRPAKPWQPGKYRLQVATYLEDLAGNNLNKLFDRDIMLQQKKDDVFVEREFVIR